MRTKKILIVDDEEPIRHGIALALGMNGYVTVDVDNAEDAVREIEDAKRKGLPFNLMICDIQMPGMTGEELIDRLRSKAIELPFLVITGYGEKALVVRLMRKGCRDFIDKPFEPSEIEKRVDMIFAQDDTRDLERKRTESLAKLGLRTRQLAHDMNNVLAGTLGYADLAQGALEDAQATQTYLTKIVKTTSRAAEICQTLLSASQCKETPAFVPTEMNSLTQRAGVILRDVVAQNIVVETKTDASPLWCSVNAERVQQAILNLGINAAQAMKDGGSLELRCSGTNESGRQIVRLTLSDTGCGIPKEIMNRLFENGFTTRKNGNGIGLHTVKEIVEEHGAEIRVTSEANRGTTFSIDFLQNEAAPISNERNCHENA